MDWVALIGYIVSLITAFVGWLVGKYARRKTAIGNLMETINELSKQVSEYQARSSTCRKRCWPSAMKTRNSKPVRN